MSSKIVPNGFTLFCDDVRTENNGKHILIGVYGADMVVGQFPFAQPLWVVTELVIPAKMKLRSHTFRLFRNSDTLIETATQDEQIDKRRTQVHAESESVPWPGQDIPPPGEEVTKTGSLKLIFRIERVAFEEPCALRARWDIGDQIIKAGSLRVVSQRDVEQRNKALSLLVNQDSVASAKKRETRKRKSS